MAPVDGSRAKTSVVVNCPWSALAVRSSTARIDVTCGPPRFRAEWTTTSTASVTSEVSAPIERSRPAPESWATNLSRVSAWREVPAWIVVNPLTPEERVRSSGSASRLPALLLPPSGVEMLSLTWGFVQEG